MNKQNKIGRVESHFNTLKAIWENLQPISQQMAEALKIFKMRYKIGFPS